MNCNNIFNKENLIKRYFEELNLNGNILMFHQQSYKFHAFRKYRINIKTMI